MKTLFLASSIGSDGVAGSIAENIPSDKRKTAFITTASEGKKGDLPWLARDRQGLANSGFVVTDYTVTGKTQEEIEYFLRDFDVICIEGGNTYYLLNELKKSGADRVLAKLVEDGKIYIGSSAGSIIAGPTIRCTGDIMDREWVPNLTDYTGLCWVEFLLLPHWGVQKRAQRHLEYNLPLFQKESAPILLLTDSQYIYVKGDSMQIVTAPNQSSGSVTE